VKVEPRVNIDYLASSDNSRGFTAITARLEKSPRATLPLYFRVRYASAHLGACLKVPGRLRSTDSRAHNLSSMDIYLFTGASV
jgi:hypothetical protein